MKSVLIFAVCCVHLFFVCFIVFKKPPIAEKKKMHPIAVRTVKEETHPAITEKKPVPANPKPAQPSKPVQPKPVQPSKPVQPKPVQPKPEQPSKPVQPSKPAQPVKPVQPKPVQPSKPVQPPVQPSKPVPKKEPQKKKSVQRSAIPPSLLKELEESIAKIEDKGDKHKLSKKPTLSPVQPLHIDAIAASNDASYIDILTQHLHTSLHLPDFGEVKIELTLQQDGTVVTLKVLNAESKQNKQYLESQLPHIQFPHLTGSFAEKKEHTFSLTFCNEI